MADTTVHGHTAPTPHAEGQQHPLKLYFLVWGLLFVLSALSYMVDYAGLQGMLRWSLILIFMLLKAGLIVAVFMHMAYERLALIYAILLPPAAVMVFLGIMTVESDYTFATRDYSFAGGEATGLAEEPAGEDVGH